MNEATETPGPRKRGKGRIVLRLLGVLGLFLLVLVAVSALSNVLLAGRSQVVDRLSEADKARAAEAIQLQQTLGDSVWTGWGQARTPIIVYNEEYAFLLGYPTSSRPPDGWVKVPQKLARGGPWEEVPGDTFENQVYYRQKLPADGTTPEAFTVKVGDQWVASMDTKDAMVFGIGEQIQQDLPAPLSAIFPYRLFARMMVGSTDQYIASLLHESFHAYQGTTAEGRLAASENANRLQESRYPWEDEVFRQNWQKELDTLADAARATTDTQALELAGRFLAVRDERRSNANLSPALVDFERQREWLEGQAKYTELAIWRQAAATSTYTPAIALLSDSDFKGYKTAEERRSQEIDQARRMAGDQGDGRFYYSGMLQADLLDRLAPGWKSGVLGEGVWLEGLLRQAVEQQD